MIERVVCSRGHRGGRAQGETFAERRLKPRSDPEPNPGNESDVEAETSFRPARTLQVTIKSWESYLQEK